MTNIRDALELAEIAGDGQAKFEAARGSTGTEGAESGYHEAELTPEADLCSSSLHFGSPAIRQASCGGETDVKATFGSTGDPERAPRFHLSGVRRPLPERSIIAATATPSEGAP